MRRITLLLTLSALVAAGVLAVSIGQGAQAQSGGGYDLTWWTVDGGGGSVSGGGYTLIGTAGQPEVGPALTGGGYSLSGGFWPGAAAPGVQHVVYLPVVLRQ